jgi:hypothetical protein
MFVPFMDSTRTESTVREENRYPWSWLEKSGGLVEHPKDMRIQAQIENNKIIDLLLEDLNSFSK